MFSTTGLFKSIACPEGERCTIIHCIFSHELRPKATTNHITETKSSAGSSDGNAAKRRKLNEEPKPPVTAASTHLANASKTVSQPEPSRIPKTLSKPVSPPPAQKVSNAPAPKVEVKETLNPRMIPYDPAGHAKRTLFLQHLHAQMKRLNDEMPKTSHPKKASLTLTDNELIKAALDEEEKLARENSKVYANVIKNRIAAYKKMNLQDWIAHVLANIKTDQQENQQLSPAIDTGLPLDQEHVVLPHLITDQVPLAKHGYVPTPPTSDDIAEAQAAVAASLNYEVCDRCKSRFRVFPDRMEDGSLTTNVPCLYHWAKPFTPRREKTDAIKGPKETIYPCCQEPLGTLGCTKCDSHVFKISEAKRLAAVLPFITTPDNTRPAKAPNGRPPSAVTFDCEMGYTVCGLELIRLTAVSWPEGDCLVDVLVRPQGAILDLNSRWSGVTPEIYSSAIPYEEKAAMDALLPPPPPGSATNVKRSQNEPLSIVASPAAARDLLCSFLTPTTPLIGHAIENDLNSVRLCHPMIIDTIVLFPHPRGLPLRFGLKMLTKRHLGRDIQMGGDAGHDSLEDARATGDLVRWKVGQRLKELTREGWTVADGALMPPLPSEGPPMEGKALGAGTGIKRQRIEIGQQGENKRLKEE